MVDRHNDRPSWIPDPRVYFTLPSIPSPQGRGRVQKGTYCSARSGMTRLRSSNYAVASWHDGFTSTLRHLDTSLPVFLPCSPSPLLPLAPSPPRPHTAVPSVSPCLRVTVSNGLSRSLTLDTRHCLFRTWFKLITNHESRITELSHPEFSCTMCP